MKTMKEYISTAEGMMQMWDDINEILDDFDFGRVFAAMEAVEWRWAVPKGEYDTLSDKGRLIWGDKEHGYEYQPELDDLYKRARTMLLEVVKDLAEETDEKTWTSNTGGFEASVRIIDDEERIRVFGEDAPDDFAHSVELRLRFILEDNMPKTW